MTTYVTKDTEETQELALKIAKDLKGGEVIFLFGDMGAGKTTFTQGLAKGLQISHRIVSPTFIIMRSYTITKNSLLEAMNFYHIDLYRTKTEADIASAGVYDVLARPHTISVVEWPEKIKKNIPQKRIEIRFKRISDGEREITVQKYE